MFVWRRECTRTREELFCDKRWAEQEEQSERLIEGADSNYEVL